MCTRMGATRFVLKWQALAINAGEDEVKPDHDGLNHPTTPRPPGRPCYADT